MAKCPDDKTKTNACAFTHDAGTSGSPITEFLIFKKCGKGEKCDYENSDEDYICIDKEGLKLRKIGKSCNYDEDCKSGYCNSNKCSGVGKGQVCSSYDSSIPESFSRPCDTGLVCADNSSPGTKNEYRCIEPILTAGTIPEHTRCGNLLEQDADRKCQKYGSIEDGGKTGNLGDNHLLCKSGISHPKTDDNGETYNICDRIETDPKCGEDENGNPKVTSAGKWAKGGDIPVGLDNDCLSETDYTGKNIYYYQYSKLQSKLYEEYLEDYEDIDIEKYNTKDNYKIKWKTEKKRLLYKYAPELQAAGLIDSDGKVVKDKKCEYEFIMKNVLSSSNTKVGFLVLALFALLL